MLAFIKKNIYFIFGSFFFMCGFVGIFLPILPTTPFMLLAAYFFSRSSKKIHQWMLSLPLIGDGVKDWNESKVIRTKAKVLSCSIIYSSMFFLIKYSNAPIWGIIPACLIMFSVSVFILTRKSQ